MAGSIALHSASMAPWIQGGYAAEPLPPPAYSPVPPPSYSGIQFSELGGPPPLYSSQIVHEFPGETARRAAEVPATASHIPMPHPKLTKLELGKSELEEEEKKKKKHGRKDEKDESRGIAHLMIFILASLVAVSGTTIGLTAACKDVDKVPEPSPGHSVRPPRLGFV